MDSESFSPSYTWKYYRIHYYVFSLENRDNKESSILGIISAYLFVLMVGGKKITALSMVPKSVTTPIA